MAGKIWCKPWADEDMDAGEFDLDCKTLTDFRCEKCGNIHRVLITLREIDASRHCEFCGGRTVSKGNRNIQRFMKENIGSVKERAMSGGV